MTKTARALITYDAVLRTVCSLLGLNVQAVSTLEERRKQAVIAIALALPVTLVFALVNYYQFHFEELAQAEIIVAVLFLLPAFLLLNIERAIRWAESLILWYGIFISSALIVYGGLEGSGVLWVFTYPFLAFFIKGQRLGWLYCLAWVAVCWLAVKLLGNLPHAWHYPDAYVGQMIPALLFYSTMAAAFNLVRARFEEMLHDKVETNTARARAYLDQLQFLAQHDEVTGLPNRNRLNVLLEEAIAQCNPAQEAIVVIDLRLERLFEISNILGERGGDLLMESIARSLQDRYGKIGCLGRLRRDEFGFFYQADLQNTQPCKLAEAVSDISLSYQVDNYPIHIENTIGIALYPQHAQTPAELWLKAEQAMLHGRASKLDISIYNEELNQQFVRRNLLFGQLRHALSTQELSLHFQPQIDLKTGRLVGAEALARWRTGSGQYISPAEFIPVAESSGLIKPFTKWLLSEFFRQTAQWRQAGMNLHFSVNLSARNLADPELISDLRHLLAFHAIPAENIVLEITECSFSDSPDQFMMTVDQLHRMGFRQSIDDFGTGYSSLSYLKDLRVNELKIDQSFVTNLTTEKSCIAIVKSTIQLAHNLGLTVVAEGIESEEVATFLSHAGCDIGQGYYYSKPLPVEAFFSYASSSEAHRN